MVNVFAQMQGRKSSCFHKRHDEQYQKPSMEETGEHFMMSSRGEACGSTIAQFEHGLAR